MRKILLLFLVSLVLGSCSFKKRGDVGKPGRNGDIVTSQKKTSWTVGKPYGMVAIPGGAFVVGQSDIDFTNTPVKSPLRTVTVAPFFMDETEITNGEYFEFVRYVRDSIVRTVLAEKLGGESGEGAQGMENYAYKGQKEGEKSPYLEYLESLGERDGYDETKKLDWKAPIYWETDKYPSVAYAEAMESLYFPPEERFNDERQLDVRKLVYKFSYQDRVSAVKSKERGDEYTHSEEIAIYPDTTVWLRDFEYSYNEPMFQQYFWHEAFKQYPVVGVNWNQARAFCEFRTKTKNDYNNSKKKKISAAFSYRLPSEIEWEYAARGGLENAPYPWGGPYLLDDRGCYLANFKPKRGDYMEDHKKGNYMYTAPVKSFPKNGFGLYDMAGNVSEWTVSSFVNSAYTLGSTLNPYIHEGVEESKKVIRGGSWKDIGYLLMVSSRDWEYKDSARSYIGFRCVQTIPESAKVTFPKIKKYQEKK